MMIPGLKRQDVVEIAIESLAFGGKGVAHFHGFTIFVDRALPGQKVRAKIKRKKNNYAEAEVVEIITHSKTEVIPECSHFGTCGGCLLQHLSYSEQLNQKRNQVQETLKHIGGIASIEVLPTLPSPDIYYYRNKMEFSFARRRWLTADEIHSGQSSNVDCALGLHVSGFYDKVLNIDNCFLLSQRSNEVMRLVRNFASESGLSVYSTGDHTGFWRFLVIRESKRLDHVMINLVTADHSDGQAVIQKLADNLKEQFPFITTIIHNINRKKSQIAFGDEEHVIFGTGYIEELLGESKYRISANSFFQTNSIQAEAMYQLIVAYGNFQNDQVIYDLYCGTGGIAIYIAKHVEKVIGFELIPQAIEDARVNCAINHIENCRFIQGDIKTLFTDPSEIKKENGSPKTVILDPPRSGLHPKLPGKILELEPEKIIYVSCNPATLARDLTLLCETSFKPTLVQPIDMFPHTAHCEMIVLLERANAKFFT
ncbi:MAG: 23S rRNA (uracil(1939)-C(5))-methyltransferase RlmD [bacterium]|nr:23S rRNA (uracil(1939)-C(5))-methyltransferase RlmD [bacterium]